jgi:ribonucleoside-diphosphate reductase beta chain
MIEKSEVGIFENTLYLNPKYSFLDKYVHMTYKSFWTPAQYEALIKKQDSEQYFNEFDNVQKECVKRCILAVAMVEDKVKVFWPTLHIDIPQTVVSDVGGLLGMTEVTHRRAYHSLLDILNINLEEIYLHKPLEDRLKYLTKHLDKDPKIIGKKRILKKLVLFTALVERASLFTQFYILMSFAQRNVGLNTISALQRSTSQEEITHYSFGIDLINIIKQEYPHLWEEYLIESIVKNIKDAYEAEVKLIDWIFEKGTPVHITKDEVLNYLNYNFSIIVKDLGLDLKYEVNEKIFREKNIWMLEKIKTMVEPDFFANAVGGYSATSEEIDYESFKF